VAVLRAPVEAPALRVLRALRAPTVFVDQEVAGVGHLTVDQPVQTVALVVLVAHPEVGVEVEVAQRVALPALVVLAVAVKFECGALHESARH
jgi:hypothetical protein